MKKQDTQELPWRVFCLTWRLLTCSIVYLHRGFHSKWRTCENGWAQTAVQKPGWAPFAPGAPGRHRVVRNLSSAATSTVSPVGKRVLRSSCNFRFDFHMQYEPGLPVQLEGRWITSLPARGKPEGLKPMPAMRTVFRDKFTTSRTQADPECWKTFRKKCMPLPVPL